MKTRKRAPAASFQKLSPNRNRPRTGTIRRLTPHHVGGNCTPETILSLPSFQNYNVNSGTSANYATGSDGRTGLGVEESDRAWTTSSSINDQESITSEIANNGGAPDWHMSAAAINAWMDQGVETATFYGFKQIKYVEKPVNIAPAQVEAWIKTWAKDDEMIVTLHCWYKATVCPGPYFTRQLPWLVKEMNKRLADPNYKAEAFVGEGGTATGQPIPVPTPSKPALKTIDIIAKEVINGAWGNGEDRVKRLTTAGYDASAVQVEVNRITATPSPSVFKAYEIFLAPSAQVSGLNIRKGPDINQPTVRTLINDKNTYTIVEEKTGPSSKTNKNETGKWGKLKSGEGWIFLKYTKRK